MSRLQSKPECRESRAVPFNANAIVWECVADGVLGSADVDAQGRLESPVRAPRAPLPFERQCPPGSIGGKGGGRLPLAPTNGNMTVERRVFSEELHTLELRVEHMAKRLRVQDALIKGFCKLEIARK